jgi:hypothetical protein
MSKYDPDQCHLSKRATTNVPQHMALATKDMFEHPAELYFKFEHGAVKKTYSLATKQYYKPIDKCVLFLIEPCIIYNVRK